MQKVIIDTNVLISALIQRNFPFFILDHCIFGNQVSVVISEELLEEYLRVLNRPKFSKYPDFIGKAEFVLSQLETRAQRYFPKEKVDIIADAPDNRLLELALESQADFLITGNTQDFTMREFYGTRIVTPKEFWELYRE